MMERFDRLCIPLLSSVIVSIGLCQKKAICIAPKPPKTDYVIDGVKEGPSSWLVQYDLRSRNPKWAYEYLTRTPKDGAASDANRNQSKFFPEPSIAGEDFKVKPTDYKNTGYDRGHLVPAADFMRKQEDIDSTFTMTNISPQHPSLNKGFWAKLEAWLRFLLTSQYEEMIIITGPVFAPTFVNGKWAYFQQTIGIFPKLISVPTHFFKVVLAVKHDKTGVKNVHTETRYIAAFLVPNAEVNPQEPLDKFLVRIDQLESLVGIQFFDESQLPIPLKSEIDNFVPRSRDLSIVLAQGQLPAAATPTNTSSKNAGSLVPARLTACQHLCRQLDCSRPLFAKAGKN